MTMGYRGKTTNSRREVVAVQAQAEREAQWGEIPGTIVDFDPATQTATIQPNYKPLHNGEPVDMPQLLEVPVRFARVGGFVVTAPVKAGDKVSLRPLMRSSENFHSGEDYTTPSDTRSFALSDMEAHLDGGEPLSDPIPGFNSNNMEIRSADGQFAIEMSEDGKFRMRGAEGNWFDLLATGFELLGTEDSLDHQADYAEIGAKLRGMAL
ncbi:baseplate assembly protein V [Rhizobium phage RHph_I72]|nr:baseplate assembly protein V [Rhizobium phage RHph_I65]QIG76499.1 baseplate assembly protein V [Rhizobium phage RHph_I72]